MRRLPVFFLIDVSESMVGEPVKNVDEGIKMIISNLKSNPQALETVYISIIVFAGKAKTVVPLTDILQFCPPDLPIGGGTSLGKAMNFLMDEINRQVQKTTRESKGDWKPIIFLLTDGSPTDQCSSAITRWRTEFKDKATLVAIAMDDQIDTTVLRELTDKVLIFKSTDPKVYKEFFQWVTASIEIKSMNIALGRGDEFQLQDLNKDVLQEDNREAQKAVRFDERFAIILARCQNKKRPYLIKYKRESDDRYNYEGAYPISEEYFALSAGEVTAVKSEFLFGKPECPYCKNSNWGKCLCGKILCVKSDNPSNRCPWCGQEAVYGVGSFDVSQTQG